MSRTIRPSSTALIELCTIVLSIEEMFLDLKKHGKDLIYAPDYSLLAPVAWPARSSSTKATDRQISENLDYVGVNLISGYELVADKAEFGLVITPPTFLELQKSLIDSASAYDSIAYSDTLSEDLFRQVENFANGTLDKMPTHATSMVDELVVNISSLPDDINTSGINTIIDMMRSGQMKGIHDLITIDQMNKNHEDFSTMSQNLLIDLRNIREQRKREDYDDYIFRNYVDAVNISFSYVMSNDNISPFIPFLGPTPSSINKIYPGIQDASIRNPLSPYLMIAAMMNSSEVDKWADAKDYLEILLDKIKPLIKYLKQAESLSKLPAHKEDAIIKFYETEMSPLFDHRERQDEIRLREMKRATSLLSSRDAFRNRFSVAADDMRKQGHEMISVSPGILGDEIINFYDMRGSKKAREILKKYGID